VEVNIEIDVKETRWRMPGLDSSGRSVEQGINLWVSGNFLTSSGAISFSKGFPSME